MAQVTRHVIDTQRQSDCTRQFESDLSSLAPTARATVFAARAHELRNMAAQCWQSAARIEMLRAAYEWQAAADRLLFPDK
ncbi:MAG: hypothetical protein AB7E79_09190 [Rhodospirillaceae bacterium]